MWCRICRQDVPALSSGEKQTLCCPRCGEMLRAERQASVDENGSASCASDDESVLLDVPFGTLHQPPTYDGWQLDEELQHLHRLLHVGNTEDCSDGCLGEKGAASLNAAGKQAARFDPPQAGVSARHIPAAPCPARPRRKIGRRGMFSSVLTWLAFTLGLASSASGGVLLGWSLVTGRQDLWNLGTPIALVGLIFLLAGLVLQIDRLCRDNRAAASKLDEVDEQLHELKTTTMLLNTSQGPASATFYSHLAGGASPQLLLTDLKSQLDLLAIKIAQEA